MFFWLLHVSNQINPENAEAVGSSKRLGSIFEKSISGNNSVKIVHAKLINQYLKVFPAIY